MRILRGFAPLVGNIGMAFLSAFAAEPVCKQVVGLLTTEFVYNVPNSELARIELRLCSPKDSSTIQIVAWRSGEKGPSLVVNTGDFGIVQTAARGNVFVVETGGATRDQVFAVLYKHGEPTLVLRRVSKGSARIAVSPSSLDLEIDGIYAGDAPPRTESWHFDVDQEEIKAPLQPAARPPG